MKMAQSPLVEQEPAGQKGERYLGQTCVYLATERGQRDITSDFCVCVCVVKDSNSKLGL